MKIMSHLRSIWFVLTEMKSSVGKQKARTKRRRMISDGKQIFSLEKKATACNHQIEFSPSSLSLSLSFSLFLHLHRSFSACLSRMLWSVFLSQFVFRDMSTKEERRKTNHYWGWRVFFRWSFPRSNGESSWRHVSFILLFALKANNSFEIDRDRICFSIDEIRIIRRFEEICRVETKLIIREMSVCRNMLILEICPVRVVNENFQRRCRSSISSSSFSFFSFFFTSLNWPTEKSLILIDTIMNRHWYEFYLTNRIIWKKCVHPTRWLSIFD